MTNPPTTQLARPVFSSFKLTLVQLNPFVPATQMIGRLVCTRKKEGCCLALTLLRTLSWPDRLFCHVWRLWPSWKLSGFCFLAERVSPMDVGGEPWSALSAEGLSILREGIFLVLSCWWGIQWRYIITPWPYTNSAMILSPGSPSPKVPFLGLKMSSFFFF